MKGKYWAVAIPLLLVFCLSARAAAGSLPTSTAGGFPKLAAGGFQTLAAGAGAQIEMRRAKVTGVNAGRLFVPAPGDSWQPLLQVATPWFEHYAGVFVKTSGGRLSLMIATLASRQATLVELRVSVRQLLDGLRTICLLYTSRCV